MTGKVILISVGQAGNQVADKFWEKIALEHGLDLNGKPVDDGLKGQVEVFFHHVGKKYVPRSVRIDLEPGVVESMNENKKEFYDPSSKVVGSDGAGNNWAVGYSDMGSKYLKEAMEKIEENVSRTDNLAGFIVTHSIGGGTGSGFGTLIMQNIKQDYPNVPLVSFSIFPSPRISDVLTEPYNSIFSLHRLVQDTNATIVLDNDAMYKIAESQGIKDPTYSDLNRLISQVMVNITAGMRFTGTLNLDLRKLVTNMVPHPRLHFLVASASPFRTVSGFETLTIQEMANNLYDTSNVLAEVNFDEGAFISSTVLFRGDVSSTDMNLSLRNVKEKLRFVDWIPTGFKTGLSAGKPLEYEIGAAMIGNHTSINQVLNRLVGQFDKLWNRKAFVHWYTDAGLTEEDIVAARDDISNLISEYDNALSLSKVDEDQSKDTSSSNSDADAEELVVNK